MRFPAASVAVDSTPQLRLLQMKDSHETYSTVQLVHSPLPEKGPNSVLVDVPQQISRRKPTAEQSFVSGSDSSRSSTKSSSGSRPVMTTTADPNIVTAASTESVSSSPKWLPKKADTDDRVQRSRERNRIHARKTRQRKKEQMQSLEGRATDLKHEQIRLKQIINEKNTANILVGLFSKGQSQSPNEDPRVEALMYRSVEEIPDPSKIPELPALILPGQHASKKIKVAVPVVAASPQSMSDGGGEEVASTSDVSGDEQQAEQVTPDDGIDYDLLGKDRSKCTPEELDQIRRERNRMHAKRTRDRKRIFTEEMAEMCRILEEENHLLREHLGGLDSDFKSESTSTSTHVVDRTNSVLSTPTLASCAPPQDMVSVSLSPSQLPSKPSTKEVAFNQLQTLLDVAGSFERQQLEAEGKVPQMLSCSISATSDTSTSDSSHHHRQRRCHKGDSDRPVKRQRHQVPRSITTTTSLAAPVGW